LRICTENTKPEGFSTDRACEVNTLPKGYIISSVRSIPSTDLMLVGRKSQIQTPKNYFLYFAYKKKSKFFLEEEGLMSEEGEISLFRLS